MLRINRRSLFLFIPFMLLSSLACAQEPDLAGRTNLFSVRLTGAPLGYFLYAADAGSHTNWFDSPLHEMTLQAEYYLFPQFGVELTIDFKGYAWSNMSTPYPFVNFWGVPGFKVGVGAVEHPLAPESPFDLTLAAGIEGGLFWEDETYQYFGLGLSARLGILWRPVRAFGFGVEGAVHYATHFTDGYYYPFELFEFDLGLVVGLYF